MDDTKLAFENPDFNLENFSMDGVMTISAGDWETDEF